MAPSDTGLARRPIAGAWLSAARASLRRVRHRDAVSILFFSLVYAGLGALSLSTAYVQANAAAVWLPSGFAVGLLLARGRHRWPAIALGSFLLNGLVNLLEPGGSSAIGGVAIALSISAGNTLEALSGAFLARRLAGGAAFLSHPRGLAVFSLLVAPLPPLISTIVGITASFAGGMTTPGNIVEVTLIWYIANAVGILIFSGPTILVLSGGLAWPAWNRRLEALLLLACLIFASQSISGLYVADMLHGWPRIYMVMPLLCWASFRFGTPGALFSVVLVVGVSTIGTMRGFQAFPADTPSRSLLYLQMFLAMLSVMALSIAAARAEVERLQASLEERVRDRTAEVERLLREKEVFTTVVAHDLQSPLYGVRNALRAAVGAIDERRIDLAGVAHAMTVMEEACAALASRVAVLLVPEAAADTAPVETRRVRTSALLDNIIAAHRFAIEDRTARIQFSGDRTLAVRRPDEVEHVLDILIGNAIRYSPQGSTIDVAAYVHGGMIDILVSDNGPGIPATEISRLFLRREPGTDVKGGPRNGLGLNLASELANGLGGTLAYSRLQPAGSRFRLSLPC